MGHNKQGRTVPMTSVGSGTIQLVAHQVHCYTNQIVNVSFVGDRSKWVLVDAGMPHSGSKIMEAAEELFGEGAKPKAIVLTHGHFDHVGSLIELLDEWDVPVYAHPLEAPYLTGETSYNEPDPSVSGGMVAKLSAFFPNKPVDISEHLHNLPHDGTIPFMPGWQWIHTPGHTQGHISIYRASDKTLIAGDAFTTVRQEDMLEVVKQDMEINGPPRYFTPDWEAAELSVKKLAALMPHYVVTGHGVPAFGEELVEGLTNLAGNFQKIAVPEHGKYVDRDK
ncbi:MBL fold metallo-hydrolase [Oceanobacillus kapialis]|uniref:MBL fold metallo-hydrolase n=1 Tax=Oceanobacillus kapialis TaxID=481353 RepID=UPI003850A239